MGKYKRFNCLEIPPCRDKDIYEAALYKTVEDIDFAIVGIPFDTASSYRTGSRFGPSAVREISSLIKP